MGIFNRKKRPTSSTPEPSTSSRAMAFEPPPNSEAYSYDRDSEEARILFSNLNIQNQVPEPHRPIGNPTPEWPALNQQSSSGFQSSSHHQASLNVPSHSNTPSYPDFSWDPPTVTFPSPANVDTSPNESFDDFSAGFGSPGLVPPPSPPDTFPEYSGPIRMGFSCYGVSAQNDGDSFPSSSQVGGDNLGEHYSTQNWNPVTESLAPDRMEPNFNPNESFSHPFPIEYPTAPMQYSLHASMEAQRLAYEQQQQMIQQATEMRRQAELSASQARRQAELVHAETMQHREQAWAQAAAVDRRVEIANSHMETLHRERERHLAAAEVRRGEAEVRRQAAEQRRQEAERYRQETFAAHPGTEPNLESESICPGFIEGEVWDEHGNVTWGTKLCGHDICRMNDWKRNTSQAVCNGYVDEEVVDEQGNPKWISRLCGHQECRNMF